MNKSSITANHYVGGLAGFTRNATISDIRLINTEVSGINSVGGLIGKANNNTDLTNIFIFKSSVLGWGNKTGGLIGQAKGTTIDEVEVDSTTSGTNKKVGGLIGLTKEGVNISNSSIKGFVHSADEEPDNTDTGGFVGFVEDNISITDSYGVAEVLYGNGYSWYGKIEDGKILTLENSYYSSNAGRARADFIANQRTNDKLKNGTPTTADADNPIFVGWDTDIWNFGNNEEYPYSKANRKLLLPKSPTDDMTITSGNKHLAVKWGEVFGVENYQVRWRPTTNGEWSKKVVSANNIIITDLTNYIEYEVQVRSKNRYGHSDRITATGTPFENSLVGGTDEDGDGLIEIAKHTQHLSLIHI